MYPSTTTQPGTYVDSDHPVIIEFAMRHAAFGSDIERAVSLYYAVRDGFRYDPYRIDLSPDGMKASTVIAKGHGWCATKAALLAAVCRAAGLPARVGFADVRNHLSTERLRRSMGTDIFIWHGFAEIWLDGAWIKATPAFNVQLCEKFGLLPLDFNGREDSLYHPFDRQGQRHLEYIAQRGSFDDVPVAQIALEMAQFYSQWIGQRESLTEGDFLAEAGREAR
jgi:transglutaminase-like putative cysteine protease